jgi:hypothetical protein
VGIARSLPLTGGGRPANQLIESPDFYRAAIEAVNVRRATRRLVELSTVNCQL